MRDEPFQPEPGFILLHPEDRARWRMAGQGDVVSVGGGVVETAGGTGLLYGDEDFADFILRVEWQATGPEDNSGVFLRFPAGELAASEPDWEKGLEIQIDDRGVDPEAKRTGSPLHLTGAVYKRAPAARLASRPIGQWNAFEIVARGADVRVTLNGEPVSAYTAGPELPRSGRIGLQCHHAGARVRFRRLRIRRL